MEYQLQLKPFERKDGFRYKILEVTDVALHTSQKRTTEKMGEKIKASIESNTPGRIYTSMDNQNRLGGGLINLNAINKNADLIRFIQEQEKQGVKILLHFPKSGVPIIAGKDTVEFIKSTRGKRVLRRLKKKQTQL